MSEDAHPTPREMMIYAALRLGVTEYDPYSATGAAAIAKVIANAITIEEVTRREILGVIDQAGHVEP